MKKNLLTIIGVCFAFISCSSYKPDKPDFSELKHPGLQQLYTYQLGSGDNKHLFGRIFIKFGANNSGDTFVFYDQTKQQLLLTDTLGNITASFGTYGRGPQEFMDVSSFVFSENDELYIYDPRQFMIKKFSIEGEYLSSFTLEAKGASIEGLSIVETPENIYFGTLESEYFSNVFRAGASAQIIEFDKQGNMQDLFGRYDSYTNKSNDYLYAPLLLHSKNENRIYTVQMNSYLIQGWDLESKKRVYETGSLPPSFSLGEERIKPNMSRSEISMKSVGHSASMSLYEVNDYIALYFSTSTENWIQTSDYNQRTHFLALFNEEGRLVGETQLPYQLANVVSDRLHLILNDDPDHYEIGVYEIQVE